MILYQGPQELMVSVFIFFICMYGYRRGDLKDGEVLIDDFL